MAILTISQKPVAGTPVTQHAVAGWTTVSNHGAGTIVTQQQDGSGGRTQVKSH